MKLGITKKLVLAFALGLLCLAGIGYRLYRNNHATSAKPSPPTIDQALPKALNDLRASSRTLKRRNWAIPFQGKSSIKRPFALPQPG